MDLQNVEQLPYNRGRSAENASSEEQGLFSAVELSTDEQHIIVLLEQEEQSLDQLIEQLGWDFGHLHSVLLSLIIKSRLANYQEPDMQGYDDAATCAVCGIYNTSMK